IDEGNLMFVTYNKSTNQYAIAVRGTYPYFGLALLVDLYEDLDVSHPLPWQYPTVPGALVAGGTIDGLNNLIRFTSNGVAFHTFVDSQIAPSGADIFVTGHSLGGALTTVLAPWLVYLVFHLTLMPGPPRATRHSRASTRNCSRAPTVTTMPST